MSQIASSNHLLTNVVYKDFNKYLKTFLQELVTNFPHIEHFKILNASYVVTKKLNKKWPHRLFQTNIASLYQQQILDKNEPYFMSDYFTSPFWPALVDTVKAMWIVLDGTNKDAIWNHLHLVIALNNRILAYKASKLTTRDSHSISEDDEPPL
jgi:hypothetical protein